MIQKIRVVSFCRRLFLIVAGLAIAFVSVGQATEIDGYLSSRHDRFSSGGYGGSPVDNPSFFLSGYDFSGIGREGDHPLTMISPIHFLAAKHFSPGSTATFVNQDNVIKTYTIDTMTAVVDPAFSPTTTDLMVGTLTAAIPAADKIAYYPTFSYSSLSEFDHAELLVYGKQHRVGRNELDGVEHLLDIPSPPPAANFYPVNASPSTGIAATYDYAPATGYSPDESKFESGDSGHPTFIRVGSQLGIFGVHWAIGNFGDAVDANFDSFVPYYQPQIDALMLGSGYSLETISVPEPTSIVLLVLALVPAAMSRRRRGRSC